MWNLNEHDLLSRLPRQHLDETFSNGKMTSGAEPDKSIIVPSWEECLAKLHEIAAYEDDWDGQGAAGPPRELSESALELVNALQSAGVAPPAWTVPGVNGTVGFEWLLEGQRSIDIDVTGPYTADVFAFAPAMPSEFFEIKNEVALVN